MSEWGDDDVDDEVADCVGRLVLHVAASVAVADNGQLVEELEAFQRECWELVSPGHDVMHTQIFTQHILWVRPCGADSGVRSQECLWEDRRRREQLRRRRELADRAKTARLELQNRVRTREYERIKVTQEQVHPSLSARRRRRQRHDDRHCFCKHVVTSR
jgi:hypothetical protein